MSEEETFGITVQLSKKAKDLLEDFARKTNTTVEAIFVSNIMDVLRNFYGGEFYITWTKDAVELAKEIEKQFDC